MNRTYCTMIEQHFRADRQMLFLCGPRQVGKTTATKLFAPQALYLNWDDEEHRALILQGQKKLSQSRDPGTKGVLILDEIHKFPQWKNFLKGFYDSHGDEGPILVTGSARLDSHRRGADSLSGRHFLYRMHPLSVRELTAPGPIQAGNSNPIAIPDADYSALLEHGGFPEPFLKRNRPFSTRWRRNRRRLLFKEDLPDTTRIYETGQVETLAELLRLNAAHQFSISGLASKLQASQTSIRRWLETLEQLYYCFLIRPWHKNISRSLLKEPKVYLWDWASVTDEGARHENFIASHLLKAVHAWEDSGYGEFSLHYLRTKDKREVDFVVVRDGTPWFLLEVKTSKGSISKHLEFFQEQTGAPHAFQAVIQADYLDINCFGYNRPVVVPARTLLSQLV